MKACIALSTGLLLAVLSCGGSGTGGITGKSGSTGSGGSTGSAGSSGSAGQSGGTGSGGTGGSTPIACSPSCPSGSVCVQGKCTIVPASCPCPKETYCDLTTSKCVVGCGQDGDCDVGRVCNTTNRTCFNGCHADTACATGNICDDATSSCRVGCRTSAQCSADTVCINTTCQSGCVTSTDCKATGQTCVNNACACPTGLSVCSGACVSLATVTNCGACGMACATGQSCASNACTCPSGQGLCSGACVSLATVTNCGMCGNACQKNATCTGGQCNCADLTCKPQIVFSDGNAIAGLWIGGGYAHTSETAAGVTTILRAPVAGGTIQTVGPLAKTTLLSNVAVGGTTVVYSSRPYDSSNNAHGDIFSIATPGGFANMMDDWFDPADDPHVGADATNAYWIRADMEQLSPEQGYLTLVVKLLQENLTSHTETTLATLPGLFPSTSILSSGGSQYWGSNGTSYTITRATGTTSLTTLYTSPANVQIRGLAVDSAGIYVSELATSPGKIFRLNLNGTTPTDLVTTGASSQLATDATYLYYIAFSGTTGPIYRVAKAGGQAAQMFYSPTGGASYLAVDSTYVYFVASNQIQRLSTSYTP